jgi:hypothetical protein
MKPPVFDCYDPVTESQEREQLHQVKVAFTTVTGPLSACRTPCALTWGPVRQRA